MTEADDVVQDTLLRVWSRMAVERSDGDGTRPVSDLRAYAFATLRHRVHARPRQTEELTDAPSTPPTAANRLTCERTLAALDALPPDQAHLLRLRALDGMSYAEIAGTTGLPLGTVTSRLSRGRAAIRAAMGIGRDSPLTDLLNED